MAGIRHIMIFSLALLGFVSLASAQDSPCDTDYFSTLKARAWLEAQREITQNQNLIFKPDSVFEYTCFDIFASELADHAKDMFSETQRWGAIPGIDIDSMDNALNAVVGDALIQYIDQNFESDGDGGTYDLLGGRLSGIDHDPKPIEGNANADIAGEDYKGVTYACDIMNQVWMAAKCMNFIDDGDNDGFYTFEEYANSDDKRFLPSQCAAIKSRWTEGIKTAITDTPWTEDDVETFLKRLDPKNCGNKSFSIPIPTGVTVYRAKAKPKIYAEHVCLLPGCYYKPPETSTNGSQIGDKCVTDL